MAAGEALAHANDCPTILRTVFGCGVGAVSARGRSQAGEKTMLDVLFPVLETLKAEAARPDLIERVRATASEAVARTVPMQATKGRASYLGARSVGHIDPGARSSCVLLACRLRHLGGAAMNDTVGIVIVSHSKDIAKGTADMVRQMVGSEVKVAFCGGNPDGGLGTNVSLIIDAINNAWSPKGVAVLVDLGGAETNSEMAVEMLQPERRDVGRGMQRPDRRGSGHGGDGSGRRQFARPGPSRGGGTFRRLSRERMDRSIQGMKMLETSKRTVKLSPAACSSFTPSVCTRGPRSS